MHKLKKTSRLAVYFSVLAISLSAPSAHADITSSGSDGYPQSLIILVNASAKASCKKAVEDCIEENCSGKYGGNVSVNCGENNCYPQHRACLKAAK